jgi:hypothetical protein
MSARTPNTIEIRNVMAIPPAVPFIVLDGVPRLHDDEPDFHLTARTSEGRDNPLCA